jgi:hypothetical protein
MRKIISIMLIFPVFSLTSFIGLSRLNNVALAVFLVGIIELVSKKMLKLNATLIYCWLITVCLATSIILRFVFEENQSISEFTFPLYWILLPLFLTYWRRNSISWSKFPDYFFFLNFFYAFLQILATRLFGYSLMIHRTFSEYEIPDFSQDSPFSYLGLSGIHQFISGNIGAAATGLLIERVDLMLLCIICIFRNNRFNYQIHIDRSNKRDDFISFLPQLNTIMAIILLTICGSSISLFVVLLPFLYITIFADRKLLFNIKIRRLKFPEWQKAIALALLCAGIILYALFFSFEFFSQIVSGFDMSARISALNSFSSILTDSSQYFSQLVYGSGVVTTSNLETLGLGSDNSSLLPRSLDIFGYTFNSFGLLGLVPFLTCYPLLLRSQTSLKWTSILLFCAFAFVSAGSPLSYTYTYGIILSQPNNLAFK